MGTNQFFYGSDILTVKKAISLAEGTTKGTISDEVREKILTSERYVREMVNAGKTVYGVTTGFGILANTRISEEDTATLQYKILQSHSVGVGKPIPTEIAKLMLITKVHALAQGFSGISPITLDRIVWHIDNNIIPVVPEKGSVGASGDLAPLAHLFLPLIGLGQVEENGIAVPSLSVLQKHNLEPLTLGPKEGLSLINGTQFILSFAIKAVQRLDDALNRADIIGAM